MTLGRATNLLDAPIRRASASLRSAERAVRSNLLGGHRGGRAAAGVVAVAGLGLRAVAVGRIGHTERVIAETRTEEAFHETPPEFGLSWPTSASSNTGNALAHRPTPCQY